MKKQKKYYFMYVMVVVVFCISVGYAAISRTLNITGNSEVKQNTWDVHFENIKITSGSVEAISAPVIDENSKLAVSFNVMLNLPGDFYEFTVDVVNDGTIDAMIDSITKTSELTATQAKYINYKLEYQNGEIIQAKQLVKVNEFVRLKVRVEYRTDLTESDLPTTTETLNLGFSINYIQADSTGIEVLNNGSITKFVYIEDVKLEYEDGMSWGDLVYSKYNDGNLKMDSQGYISYNGSYLLGNFVSVYYSDLIDMSISYEFAHIGGGIA